MKPFIKWVGGKTQIIDKVSELFPTEIINYHEIFLGGGSVLLHLLSNDKIKVSGTINAYDINKTLIYVYKNIQSQCDELNNKLKCLMTKLNNLPQLEKGQGNKKPMTSDEGNSNQESFYYWIRRSFNELTEEEKCSVYGSALFIFLNKTCFRGLYRVGPNGFNVPFGHYKNPQIDFEHISKISDLIQCVNFEHSSFDISMTNVSSGDFVYLDPPYAPETSKSFVGYNHDGFDKECHDKLFKLTKDLPCKFLMSNADVDLVHSNFPGSFFDVRVIECKRSINSTKPGSTTTEVLIQR